MNPLDDAKAKVDKNNDGKVSIDELEDVRTSANSEAIDQLQRKARRYDGKVNIDGIEDTLVKL